MRRASEQPPLLGCVTRCRDALAIVLALAVPRTSAAQAGAERTATAQGLYDSAAELIKAGKYAEACPKLEESQRLDPAMGTQFFLATCYENTGRPTKAWSLFIEVANAAKAAGNGVRETTARQRAAVLEPRLPRVTVWVADANARVPGLAVTRDETELQPVVWGTPIPVDLGAHVVRATAPGKASFEATVTVRELGQKVEVRVPPLLDARGGPAPAPARARDGNALEAPQAGAPVDARAGAFDARAAARSSGMAGQRVAAIVVGSLGLAGVVAGSALGAVAGSAWSQASAECPSHLACSPDAHEKSTRAVSLATGSTAAFVGGGAAVVGGVILWFTTPKARPAVSIHLAPLVGAGTAGATLKGDF